MRPFLSGDFADELKAILCQMYLPVDFLNPDQPEALQRMISDNCSFELERVNLRALVKVCDIVIRIVRIQPH